MRLFTGTSTKKFLWITVLACVAVTSLPYIYGYFMRPEGATYSGIHHIVQGDTNVYLTMIEQTRAGQVLYNNLFTSEANPHILFNPLWLVLGVVAKVFSISALLAFQIGRIALIPLFIFIIYRLLSLFISNERTRRITLVVALFSSGIGLFFDPVLFDAVNPYNRPIDIWVPESNSFLSMLQSPHFLLSQILLLSALYFAIRANLEKRMKLAVFGGLCSAFLFLVHPFYVPTVWGIVAVWAFVALLTRSNFCNALKILGIIVAMSAPVLGYFLWMDRASTVIHAWSAQNILPTPMLANVLIGYGLLIPLAIYGAIKTFRDPKWRLLVLWAITLAALIYAPLDFQRRLLQSAHVVLAILAGPVIVFVYDALRRTSWLKAIWFSMILVVLLPLTNVKIIVQDIFDYTFERTYPYYIPNQDMEAFRWIKDNTEPQDIIFSSFYTGNYLPAYTLRPVFIGHGPQTIFLRQKEELAKTFFAAGTTDSWRQQFLADWHISYIIWTEHERALGEYQPTAADFLQPVFQQGATSVFKVNVTSWQ